MSIAPLLMLSGFATERQAKRLTTTLKTWWLAQTTVFAIAIEG